MVPIHVFLPRGAENITITGRGVIDGQGQAWWDEFWRVRNENKVHPAIAATAQQCKKLDTDSGADKFPGYQPSAMYRPHLLWLEDCKNVLIHGVTLRNSPSMTLHPIRCQDLKR